MVDVSYFLAIFLISLRLSAFLFATGVFFPNGTPVLFKGALSLVISLGIVSGIDYSTISNIESNYMLAFYAVSEIMTGLILGYITSLVFLISKMAGSWIDIHAGFSMVTVLDPMTKTNSTLIGNVSYFISIAVFFLVNGHNIVIRLLAESIKIVPIGSSIVYQETLRGIMQTIFKYFELGIKIAVPIVLIIVMTDLCLGLISRTVPTIPIMIFGMPIKNILSFVTYIILLPVLIKIISNTIYNLPDIFQGIYSILPSIPLALVFASDEKTEEATPKKKADARKKGQIARSKDVSVAFTMVVCTLVVAMFWDYMTQNFKEAMIYFFSLPMVDNFDKKTLSYIIITIVVKLAKIILPLILPIMIGGIVANLLQTGFIITGEPLKPSFGKLNPISGFKNMLSKKSLVDLCKNSIVITIVTIIAYKYMKSNYQSIISISGIYLPSLSGEVKNLVLGIFKQICIVLVIIAAIDYFVQVKMYNKDMKMTKQEVKDEYKQQEGDPQVKGKIKQKQREMGMKRMMQSVADATVVITNPTHLAIALKYEENGQMEAPKVVAKGADYLALKIKTLAKDNNVPIVENKPLARLMYDRVEIDEEIPQDMYQGVAEILAVVMKLKK